MKNVAPILAILGGLLLMFGGGDTPGPGPKPNPDPKPVQCNRVLVVYESSEITKYPAKQALILRSGTFQEWLTAHCARDEFGNPEYRIWDKDVDTSNADKGWQEAMRLPRASLPWVIATNGLPEDQGGVGVSQALPESESETIALLGKYLQ